MQGIDDLFGIFTTLFSTESMKHSEIMEVAKESWKRTPGTQRDLILVFEEFLIRH